MDRKRILASVVVFLILAVLVYLQYRHWRTFDWGTFWSQTNRIKQVARASWDCVHLHRLPDEGPALEDFPQAGTAQDHRHRDGLADAGGIHRNCVAGRAGEFIRPYLIARRTDLSFSSQLAVWAVERIFDIGSFAFLIVLAIFLPSALPSIPHPEYYTRFREAGFRPDRAGRCTTVAAFVMKTKRRSGSAVGGGALCAPTEARDTSWEKKCANLAWG